jgi:aconitase A
VGDTVEVEVDGGAKRFTAIARLDAEADVRIYRRGGLLQMMLAELAG